VTPFERRLDEVQRCLACEHAEPSMRSALLRPRDLFEVPLGTIWTELHRACPTLTNDDYLALSGLERGYVVEELAARRALLVAWVPEPFIAAADAGITVNAYECLAWASSPTAEWCVLP